MWIDEYRKENGLELDDFARRVNHVGQRMEPPLFGMVSDTLIYKLEISKRPRTHPRIADAIATVCGATSEQRDMIVDEQYWDTYQPFQIGKGRRRSNPGEIVVVDGCGRIVKRYSCIERAEKYGGMSRDEIIARCNHEVQNEFEKHTYTFRIASEWERLTQPEKLEDIGQEIGKVTDGEFAVLYM